MKSLPIARTIPLDVGTIHFVGIGGIGMSGIAEILHNLGYKVQGSDLADGYNIERLRKLGIACTVGHAAENLKEAAVVVISSAVKPNNPEFMAAREQRIPIVRRAEMLAELMRLKMCVAVAGTHGKTTTTSLTSAMFEAAGLQPTVINGGIINAYGTNAKVGAGEWMIVEADESDGTFTRLPAAVAIVTNIDPEHLEHFGSFENLKAGFKQFVENIPFYGFGVLCIDHPEVQALIGAIHDRRIISYGTSPQADIRAVNLRSRKDGQEYDVEISERLFNKARTVKDVFLPMHGEHNLCNSLAAISVAVELGLNDHIIKKALAGFEGVKRRFTKTGEVRGITIIDDYGHHPVEIAATLKAARGAVDQESGFRGQDWGFGIQRADGQETRSVERVGTPPEAGIDKLAFGEMRAAQHPTEFSGENSGSKRKLIAIVQPHRYTRVRDLFTEFCTCFNDADMVVVADIYSAGEEPIEGISRESLVQGLRDNGHKHVVALEGPHQLAALVHAEAQAGDYVVCLGAGSITKWAYALPGELEKLAE